MMTMTAIDASGLISSALSACCVVGTRPARRSLVAAGVMLAAMVAVSSPLGQDMRVVLLVAVALLASAPVALGARRGAVHPMGLHRGISAVVMAGAVLIGGDHVGTMTGHVHTSATEAVVVVAVVGYVALSAVVTVAVIQEARSGRSCTGHPRRLAFGLGEVVAMTAAVFSMVAM